MDSQVFARVEKKYLITEQQKAKLLKTIKKHMKKDSYFRSEVYNLYFDTDNYDLIVQSIDRPEFKEKLRARSYAGYDRVFLEIKTKLKGHDANVGHKRRVMITRKDFSKLLKGRATLTELVKSTATSTNNTQIAQEIDYLIAHFGLKPKILIFYNRESYQGENKLRITFDENMHFRDTNFNFIKGKRDKIYFKGIKNTIMEIKAHGALPLWLVEIMSAEHIYPQQFSKIGKVYINLANKKGKNV